MKTIEEVKQQIELLRTNTTLLSMNRRKHYCGQKVRLEGLAHTTFIDALERRNNGNYIYHLVDKGWYEPKNIVPTPDIEGGCNLGLIMEARKRDIKYLLFDKKDNYQRFDADEIDSRCITGSNYLPLVYDNDILDYATGDEVIVSAPGLFCHGMRGYIMEVGYKTANKLMYCDSPRDGEVCVMFRIDYEQMGIQHPDEKDSYYHSVWSINLPKMYVKPYTPVCMKDNMKYVKQEPTKTTTNMKQPTKPVQEGNNTQFITIDSKLAPEDFPHRFEGVTAKFVDYKGDMRNFTMVAVSVEMDTVENRLKELAEQVHAAIFGKLNLSKLNLSTKLRHAELGQQIGKHVDTIRLQKGLYFGISVTKAEDNDKFDEKVGLRIALGRALNANKPENVHAIFATHPGMFNTESVRALLINEANYFIENPGSYMNGYHEARDKYLGKCSATK